MQSGMARPRSRPDREGAPFEREQGRGPKKAGPANTLWATQTTLSKAFALGGCGICNAVRAAERKGIHSFLYEGMMFPFVRQQFLDGGGFCLRHFWMAKEIEDETWPTGGFGMAILCESLTHLADAGLSEIAAVEPNARPTLLRRREANVFLPGTRLHVLSRQSRKRTVSCGGS